MDDLIAFAADQLGLVTREQLRSSGIHRDRLRRMVGRKALMPLHRNVFALPGSVPSDHRDVLGRVLETGHDAVASHTTAAWLWGLGGFSPSPTHVVVSRQQRHHQHLDWRVHQFTGLPAEDRRVLHSVPVTSPALTMLHLAQISSLRRMAVIVDRAWSLRLLDGDDLADLDARLAIQGRNGIRKLRVVARQRGADWIPPESGLETRFMQLMEEVGIDCRRQVPIRGERWSARVDFLHEPSRTVIEVQSERFHSALTDRAQDAERRRRLTESGYRVIEVWDTELFVQPGVVVERVREAILRPAA